MALVRHYQVRIGAMTLIPEPIANYLTAIEWCEREDVSRRTLTRLLSDGALPGAVKIEGNWKIPTTTTKPAPTVHTDVATRTTPKPPTVTELLDRSTVMIPLDRAAALLGVSEYTIRSHASYFEALPLGAHGSLVIPAGVIRRLAGL
jgi:hypothetical protein